MIASRFNATSRGLAKIFNLALSPLNSIQSIVFYQNLCYTIITRKNTVRKDISMKNEYDLNRFIEAQDRSYHYALQEIKNGKKLTHWIWFVFPQLKDLGRSRLSLYFGIENLEEAKLYLAHPVLGARLREICEALLTLDSVTAEELFGEIDALKVCSSMTLFAEIEGYDSIFGKIINKYYSGNKDVVTVAILNSRK